MWGLRLNFQSMLRFRYIVCMHAKWVEKLTKNQSFEDFSSKALTKEPHKVDIKHHSCSFHLSKMLSMYKKILLSKNDFSFDFFDDWQSQSEIIRTCLADLTSSSSFGFSMGKASKKNLAEFCRTKLLAAHRWRQSSGSHSRWTISWKWFGSFEKVNFVSSLFLAAKEVPSSAFNWNLGR